MTTWEQRMAQRQDITNTKGHRLAMALQLARYRALEAAKNYVHGPEPLPAWLPLCCWENVWLNGTWQVQEICNRELCDHQHHADDIFAAYAA